jgi:hypothetical protein
MTGEQRKGIDKLLFSQTCTAKIRFEQQTVTLSSNLIELGISPLFLMFTLHNWDSHYLGVFLGLVESICKQIENRLLYCANIYTHARIR